MGADAGILGLLIKLQADASQMSAEIQKGEAQVTESTDNMTKAQAMLDAEQQRASELQSQFDAEMVQNIAQRQRLIEMTQEQAAAEQSLADAQALKAAKDAEYNISKAQFLAGEEAKQRALKETAAEEARAYEISKAQFLAGEEAKQRALKVTAAEEENRAATAKVVQAMAERRAAILANNVLVERKILLAAQEAQAEQILALKLTESTEALAGRTEVAAVAQEWEERRSAVIAKSVASLGAQTTAETESTAATAAAAGVSEEYITVLKAQAAATEANTIANKEFEFSVRGMFPTFVNLRTLIRVATGIFAIGFIISEWKAFTDAITEATLAMGGFGDVAQKAMAADIKASDEALTHTKNLKDSHDQISLTLKEQADLSEKLGAINARILPPWAEYLALIGATMTADSDTIKEITSDMQNLDAFTNQAAAAEQRLIKQHENDKKLREEHARSTIEVLKSEAEVLDGTGQKAEALNLRLAVSFQEEAAAVAAATDNLDRQRDLHVIYTNQRIRLMNELNAVHEKVHKETVDRLDELLRKEQDEAEAANQMGNARIAAMRKYEGVLREVLKAENEERRAGTFGAQQAQEAYDTRNIALNIYREQLREIEEQEKEKQRREEAASNAFGLKQGGKELVEPWLKAEEAIGKYMQAMEKATDADNIAADRSQKNAAAVAEAKLQEEIRVTEAGAREALALEPFNKAYQAIVQYAEQQRLAAAFNKEESSIAAAVEKTAETLKKKSDAEEAALDRVRTPHAQSLLQVFRELQASKEHYEATMKQVGAANNLAVTLRLQAQAEEAEAKATQDSAKAALLSADAKKKEKEATDLVTASEKARKQAAIEAKAADAEAVGAAAANLLATLGYKKEAAIVDAIIQTAAGIADLAVQNYEGAALHFLSAAEYGIVAGQTPSRGSSTGAGTQGGRPGGSSGPLTPGATGSEVPLQPGFTGIGGGPPPGTLHVLVVGPNEAAQWMAGHLNNLTTRQGGQLIASRSINPTKAGR